MFILTANLIGIISLHLHRDQPPHRHPGAGADGVPHRAALRHLRERFQKFFKLFVPHGIPIHILPLIMVIGR